MNHGLSTINYERNQTRKLTMAPTLLIMFPVDEADQSMKIVVTPNRLTSHGIDSCENNCDNVIGNETKLTWRIKMSSDNYNVNASSGTDIVCLC